MSVEQLLKGADLTDDQASQIINFLKVKDLKELKDNLKNPLYLKKELKSWRIY